MLGAMEGAIEGQREGGGLADGGGSCGPHWEEEAKPIVYLLVDQCYSIPRVGLGCREFLNDAEDLTTATDSGTPTCGRMISFVSLSICVTAWP